jgi:hypothetical protein
MGSRCASTSTFSTSLTFLADLGDLDVNGTTIDFFLVEELHSFLGLF